MTWVGSWYVHLLSEQVLVRRGSGQAEHDACPALALDDGQE
jgi:hypothetical protein